jgi:hypothetical protein
MKKVSFVVAILVSAALAGCHKNKGANNPSGGSDMGSAAMGSAAPAGGGDAPAGGGSGGM